MAVELNEDQQKAFEKLKEFVNGDQQYMCLLEGCAGVGKTFLVSHFIDWIMNNTLLSNVYMCATTNKAVKVLMEMCPHDKKGQITFCTLHSLLGLRHEVTKDGKEIFIRDKNVTTKLPFSDFVIVDESSMIANQLFHEMEDQNYRQTKILFVGDSNQINPVNHSMAIPMLEGKRQEFNIAHIKLDKIVRQAEGNPIIKFSQKVIHENFEFQSGYKEVQDDTGLVMLPEGNTKILMQLIKYYFDTSNFDEDGNFCKIIAWRNATVDYYNRLVRSFKYGKNAPKIVVNEKLIVDRPIKAEKETMFSTNEDLVVKQVDISEKTLFDSVPWKYYDCLVQGFDKVESIHILHESEEKRYAEYLKDASRKASEEGDVVKRIKKWKDYFSFMDNFAQVKYAYAITAHNSQGSTYDNSFVIYSDICYNRRDDERKRILYTAMTRPKKMLFVV